MENVYGNNAFYWWVGVVEDRNDPLYLGRCKVRIVGHHSVDTGELPTSDLPWAFPMQPITSAAMSGVGQTPIGVVEGTWVIGFFRDGDDCQEPVMMGTIGGIPGKKYQERLNNTTGHGFQDPNKKYPLTELLDEPDTNRLARNQSIDKTIVQTKQINRTKKVPVAFGRESNGEWNQPDSPYNARYPYNHVTQSESGHVIEIDDTTNAERLHIYHRTGTFVEVDAEGSMVTRVIGNNYHITDYNGFISIKGKANITVDGSCNILVKNNCNIEVDGNLKTHVHGDYELNVAGKIDIAAGKAFTAYTDKDMSIQAKTGISAKSNTTINVESKTVTNIKAGTMLQMGGVIKTSISSPVTEFGIVKFNGMSIVPVPPAPTLGATVRDLTPTSLASLPIDTNQEIANNKVVYDKLVWSKVGLDRNDPDVQDIINPDVKKLIKKILEDPNVGDDLEGGSARVSQLNNIKAEKIDKALYDQGIVKPLDPDTDLKSGYKNLDELLKIAGSWARKLGKNSRVNYENLKSGYINGVHGLCPQGTQSVVVALTGVVGLGKLSGNADWFSFKNPSTGGGRSSFAVNIGGKVYYNDKVNVNKLYTKNPLLWQVGDIVVMGYLGGKLYGHIQVWTGWKWVSDFSQNAIQSNHVDTTTVALWRLNENGKAAVQSQKNKKA